MYFRLNVGQNHFIERNYISLLSISIHSPSISYSISEVHSSLRHTTSEVYFHLLLRGLNFIQCIASQNEKTDIDSVLSIIKYCFYTNKVKIINNNE